MVDFGSYQTPEPSEDRYMSISSGTEFGSETEAADEPSCAPSTDPPAEEQAEADEPEAVEPEAGDETPMPWHGIAGDEILQGILEPADGSLLLSLAKLSDICDQYIIYYIQYMSTI